MKEYYLRLYKNGKRIFLSHYLDENNKITPAMTLQKFGTPPPGTKLTIERIYNDNNNERQDEPKGERYLSGVPF
jgi:hypothetical protein